MKLVHAYIKESRLGDVTLALHKIEGLGGVTVLEARGFGRGRATNAPDRQTYGPVDFVPRVKLEIACRDEQVEPVVEAIRRAAHTGLRGDGKVYVTPIEEAMRISTGEHGEAAV